MTKHKWHKEIKAWADGAIIQFKDSNDEDVWFDCVDNQAFWDIGTNMQYRIKPQPKEPECLYVFLTEYGIELVKFGHFNRLKAYNESYQLIGKIKLEVVDD